MFIECKFGTTERSVGAIQSQMGVIQGGKLTVVEREEVREKVAKEQLEWLGKSIETPLGAMTGKDRTQQRQEKGVHYGRTSA